MVKKQTDMERIWTFFWASCVVICIPMLLKLIWIAKTNSNILTSPTEAAPFYLSSLLMEVSHINTDTSSWETGVNSLSSPLSPLVLRGNSLRLSSSSQLLQARRKELLGLSCCFCSHRSQTCRMWCRFLSPRDQNQHRDIMSVFSSSHSQSESPECVCSPVCSDVMWRQQLDSVSSNSSQTSRSCCSCFKNTLLTL